MKKRAELSELDEIFAENLNKKRSKQRKKYSQVQFSKKLGIAQSTLHRIEKGQTSITLFLLAKISEALNVHPNVMLRRSDRSEKFRKKYCEKCRFYRRQV